MFDVITQCTLGESMVTKTWSRRASFNELLPSFTQSPIGEKNGPCFTPAIFRGTRRHKTDAIEIGIAVLDSDCGHELFEIAAAVDAAGYAAFIHSTHSHLTTTTEVKPSGNSLDIVSTMLKKGFLPRIVENAKIIGTADNGNYIVSHEPCPKFRIIIPLATPWRAADYESQDVANAAWDIFTKTLAASLGLSADQSCCDTSRLFFRPRSRKDGPEYKYWHIKGQPCDMEEVLAAASPSPDPEPAAKRAQQKKTGPLVAWAAEYASRFEIVTALRTRKPNALTRLNGAKTTIECPFEREHTTPGGEGCFAVNASEIAGAGLSARTSGFYVKCMHNACIGRDRLDFVAEMLRQNWLAEEDLIEPEFLTGGKASGRGARGWMSSACFDGKGKLVPNLASVMAALRNAPELSTCFALDEMLCGTVLVSPLPDSRSGNRAPEKFPRVVSDEDVAQLQEWLQRAGLPGVASDTCHKAVDLRGRENAFHPVRDYLDGLVWDEWNRLDTWLAHYLGADRDLTEPTPYTKEVGRAFFIGLVARIYRPGCKQDYMLILEGPQGILKSKVCEIIGGEWFSDSLPEVTSGKDVSQHLKGKWVLEIGELAALTRSETTILKAFITRTTERFRPSYGRKEVIQPRQCVFIGTTNDDCYLKDETGGRRFWPVKAPEINIDALANDRDQLFAEAVYRFKAGEKWWPDRKFEAEHMQPEQEARFDTDPWLETIQEYIERKLVDGRQCQTVRVSEIAVLCLGIETGKLTRRETARIGGILKYLKWTRFASNGVRGYRRPGV